MTNGRKKSTFITQDSVPDDHFIDTFGNGVNRKVPAPKFFEQIRKSRQPFIYNTVAELKAANIKANPDDPVYVRVAETGFWLYRVTSLSATSLDIELENGATATRVYEETAVIPLPDITALYSLNTAALVDKQQFSVKDGDKIRLFAWNAGTSSFDELPAVTNTDNVAGAGTAITRDTGTGNLQIPLNNDLGSASKADVGTGSTQLPRNSDLGTASTKDTGTANDQIPINANIVKPIVDIAALYSLNTAALVDGQQFSMTGYRPGSDLGGGDLYVDLNRPQSDHDGGTVFAFGATPPADFNDPAQLEAFLKSGSGLTGNGCFVRPGDGSVYVENYGAASNGTEIDHLAFSAAVSSDAHTVLGRDAEYYFGGDVVVPADTSLIMGNDSRIIYTGVGTCVKVEGDKTALSRTLRNRTIKIMVRKSVIEWGSTDTTSRGIVLENLDGEQVYVASENFRENVILLGNEDGFAYNTVVLGTVRNGLKNLVFERIGVGFVNQNRILGGRLRFDSSIPTSVGTVNLDIDFANGNTFDGVTLEGGNGETTVSCSDGAFNFFNSCRWEGVPIGSIVFGANSNRNGFLGGFGLNDSLIDDSGTANYKITGFGSTLTSGAGSNGDPSLSLVGYDTYNALEVTDGNSGLTHFTINKAGAAAWYEFPVGAQPAIDINGITRRIRLGSGGADAPNNFVRGLGSQVDIEGDVSWTGTLILPTYADNAAAVAGGLAVGTPYKTSTGELRIVV